MPGTSKNWKYKVGSDTCADFKQLAVSGIFHIARFSYPYGPPTNLTIMVTKYPAKYVKYNFRDFPNYYPIYLSAQFSMQFFCWPSAP